MHRVTLGMISIFVFADVWFFAGVQAQSDGGSTADHVVRPWSCLARSLAGGTVFGAAIQDPACHLVPHATDWPAARNLRARAINPPMAPSGLSAKVTGQTIELTWTPPSTGGAPTSYVVQSGSARGLSNLANANSGSDRPMLTATNVPGGTYYVRVLSQNASGTSAASNEIAVEVAAACIGGAGAPSSLTAGVSGSSVTLNWAAPNAATCVPTSYTIQAGSAPGLSDLANFSTGNAATSFSTSGVPTGTYYVRVLASNSGGTSGPTNEVVVAVNACGGVPGSVSPLTFSVFGSQVSLGWTAASGNPTGYFIQAGSAPGLSDLAFVGTGGGFYIADGVPAGTYYVRVFARNACGAGPVSNEVVITVGSGAVGPSVSVSAVHGFSGSPADGSNLSTIVQGRDGNFYGTTVTGGPFNSACTTNLTGCGTAFRMAASGAITILHNFGADAPAPFPIYPYSTLLEASDGNFYGTLTEGTPVPGRLAGGAVIFRMSPGGAYTKMADLGGASYGKLVQATDGNFYGTTAYGGTGADTAGLTGNGAVFRMTPGGSLSYLKAFTGGADGGKSYGGVIQARDGNLYWMTAVGGSAGFGTIFRITTGGSFTVLYNFPGGAGGGIPFGGLIQGSDGNFYGTAQFGGGNLGLCVSEGCGAGIAFKMTPGGAVTILHAFTGTFTPDLTAPSRQASDGYRPVAALMQASNGVFYGTTAGGGAHGGGTIFSLTADGSYSQIFLFQGLSEGSAPTSQIIQASDGSFYGTGQYGGQFNKGAIYRMVVR